MSPRIGAESDAVAQPAVSPYSRAGRALPQFDIWPIETVWTVWEL